MRDRAQARGHRRPRPSLPARDPREGSRASSPAPDDELWAIVAYLRNVSTAKREESSGTAANGERIFGASCASCHRVNGRGGRLGPDLSRIAAGQTNQVLTRAIRDASASFTIGYEPMTLVTRDGQQVKGGGMTFTAIHTPGHTKGSVCFKLDVEGEPPILFSGDHLFAGSIGRTDLPGGSYQELMESMAEKILPMPDEVNDLPGHGPVTTVGRERVSNPFLL